MRKTWGSIVRTIEGKWCKVPLTVFNDARMIDKIVDWRDPHVPTPRAADNGVTALHAVLKYGIHRGCRVDQRRPGFEKIYEDDTTLQIVSGKRIKRDLLAD